MKILLFYITTLFFSITTAYAVIKEGDDNVVEPLSYDHMLDWSVGLVVVLALFIGCAWIVKKMGGLPIHLKNGLRVVSALSLGGREKLILVQVGEKQMILGVSPGRINNLLVLEGKEQLFQEKINPEDNALFSKTLKDVVTTANDK